MADRALEKAVEDRVAGAISNEAPFLADDYCQLLARAAIRAHLDSLLEGLPEEAVEAAFLTWEPDDPGLMIEAFLRSLRTGLEGGTE